MKTLSIYHPAGIQNALNDFEKHFESFFGESLLVPAVRMFDRMPAVDIQEVENAYVLDMELPGYDEKNINVHVDGNNLTVSTARNFKQETSENSQDDVSGAVDEKTEDKRGAYLLRERKISAFTRSFKLPENADPEAVSAAFKNGVLRLEIKKRAEAQKRMIRINAA
ncbi:MAG: Hsp20/alpha crystallin family protein [Treponema sp.]|nr:Hsp20/alpha crystallin family protein [Treponema sp.]